MSWLVSFAWASAYEVNAQSVEILELMNIDHLKVTAFYLSFLCKLPVPRGRCSKMICRVFFSYNICIVLLFGLSRRLLTVKSY